MIGSIKNIKAVRLASSKDAEGTSSGPAPITQASTEEGMLRFLAQCLYLSYDMVLEAHEVFERYRALDQASQSTEGNMEEETLFPRPAAGFEDRIGIAGLRALFSDLGVARSDIEIVALLERLSSRVRELGAETCETSPLSKSSPRRKLIKQSSSEDQKLQLKRKVANPGVSGREEERRVGNSSAAGHAQQPLEVLQHDASQKIRSGHLHPSTVVPPPGLSFYQFLFLLQENFHDGVRLQRARQQQEKEAAKVFREMDVDRNGVLTESDIRQVLARLLTEEITFQDDETILRLASLHPVELQAALAEFDVDSDGHVTLRDFLSVLQS